MSRIKTRNILEAVIVEDEPESLSLLSSLLLTTGLVEVTGSTRDPLEAVRLIISLTPDIVFLDIKMPGMNGFEMLDDLNRVKSVHPHIVFTTAYDDYAIKAFEFAAFDYLLKPIEPSRLKDTLMRCFDDRESGNVQDTSLLLNSYRKLFFRNISGIILIEPEEIIYVEADGNYSKFFLSDGKTQVVTSLLHRVEEQLPLRDFIRVSRSVIINTAYLKRINTKQSECVLSLNQVEYRIKVSQERLRSLIEQVREM